jgi:hypothetical protein
MADRNRMLAITGIVAALAVTVVMGWVLMRPAPQSEAGAGAPGAKQPFGPGASWMLLVGAVPGDERAVTVNVSAKDAEGRPIVLPAPPPAILRMVDMATMPERVVLAEDGPGAWRGAAQLSAAGRWALEIELDGETVSLPFQSGSR